MPHHVSPQGVTPGVEQRSSFSLHNADLVCNGSLINVYGHPALDPFTEKFKGIRYRRRPANPGRGALLQFVGPSGTLLLRNSTATFLRVNQSIALIQARHMRIKRATTMAITCVQVSEGLRATLRSSAITQNRGGFRTPLLVTDNATLHIENR